MNSNEQLSRGTVVIVIAFGNKRLRRRVWEDTGDGIWICREEEYRRAIQEHDEANCSGFPKEYIVEVLQSPVAESA